MTGSAWIPGLLSLDLLALKGGASLWQLGSPVNWPSPVSLGTVKRDSAADLRFGKLPGSGDEDSAIVF